MGNPISNITIEGFKSIKHLRCFELRNLNILIGPNGAGKSNFVESFYLLNCFSKKGYIKKYVSEQGGAERFLYMGAKTTEAIWISFLYRNREYEFSLHPTVDNELLPSIGGDATGLDFPKSLDILNDVQHDLSVNLILYHFHDTSTFANVKRPCTKRDYEYLRPDASNLAAYLLFLKKKHEKEYQRICETIQLSVPFFDDFMLRDSLNNSDETLLEWKQKGSDYPFHPNQMSDGTLRFICLVTALLQPEPPSTILLDEPELGLHPHALALLAGLIRKASKKTQVIVSTQSATLIDHFQPEDIVVVERQNGESKFRRLDKKRLSNWLEDYTLGELWQKNIFEDSPTNE